MYLSSSSEHDQLRATRGGSMGLTNAGEKDANRPRPSVLGGVRRITRKRGAGGRDIVEIEHADGTETVLVFDSVS